MFVQIRKMWHEHKLKSDAILRYIILFIDEAEINIYSCFSLLINN